MQTSKHTMDVQMCGCADVQMRDNVQMCGCANVRNVAVKSLSVPKANFGANSLPGEGREGFRRLTGNRINPSPPLRTSNSTPPQGGNLAAVHRFEHRIVEGRLTFRAFLLAFCLLFTLTAMAQTAPIISYPTPPTYYTNTAITPLTVTNTGGTPNVNGFSTTVAGAGVSGYLDGPGTIAKFNQMPGAVRDASGNIFIADAGNQRIRKVGTDGYVSTFAGSGTTGSTDGTGTGASFNNPAGMCTDASGNIYIADKLSNKIRKMTPAGVVSTVAGSGTAGYANGMGTAAQFNNPCGVAIDASGNLFVADYGNNDIREITPAGVVSLFAGSATQVSGLTNGTGNAAKFKNPFGIAIDASGNLYVADQLNHVIRKITSAAAVTTLAGTGTAGFLDGTGATAKFNTPTSLVVDAAGTVYVADELNNRIRAITSAGYVRTYAGIAAHGYVNGIGSATQFYHPFSIAIDPSANLFVGDNDNSVLRKLSPAIYTVSPALPAGLSINAMTGAISGTPTIALTGTYVVTAYNQYGAGTATINITITGITATPNQNYVATYQPRVAGLTTQVAVKAATNDKTKVETTIQYIDGIGRPLQTIQVAGSPQGNDMVQPYDYDQYGREATKYLPYAPQDGEAGLYRNNALHLDQPNFYTYPPTGVSPITNPIAQTSYEVSPLNRPVEQGAPGPDWQLGHHTVHITYTLNNSAAFADDTLNGKKAALYKAVISTNQNRTLGTGGYYPSGALTVTVSADENTQTGRAGTVEEYKDNMGHVVLKRVYNYEGGKVKLLSTYYVYDDFGLLAFVLPPLSGADADTVLSQTTLDNLCYQYRYDERNRMSQKKIPGKGWEYTVYNQLNQPVATQDSLQRAATEWIYTKYDVMGKPVISGIWTNNNTPIARQSLQSGMNAQTTYWEVPANSGAGYTTAAWPNTSVTPLTIDYYDNYKNIPGLPVTYKVTTGVTSLTRGMPTVKKTAILNTPANMLWDVMYYDDLGRSIKTYAQHYLGGVLDTGNYDLLTTTYNYTNAPTSVNRQHYKTGNLSVTIANSYYYDHMGRKLSAWEQITNAGQSADTKRLVSKIDYNEIGQVYNKHLHGGAADSTTGLQTVAYTYNERGWLLTSTAALFTMVLQYNLGTNKQYNGNIAYQSWTAPSISDTYTYTYDKLNRLLSGISTDNYKENGITYDAEGNIGKLNRYQAGTLIDKLTYNLYSGTNQLHTVIDSSGSNLGLVNLTTTYNYDGNGNLQSSGNSTNSQQNKSFTYNLLNLPQVVTVPTGTITYTYDVAGNKLRKVSVISGATKTTDYISGIQYDGTSTTDTLSFIQTEEGRALHNGTTNYDYQYYLADNLGNTRITFNTKTGTAKTIQQDDYYPFGMEISRTSPTPNPKNEYLYNKKELQEEFQEYDYGARLYDPLIGRWGTIDPLAEVSRRWSTYNYVENNPVRLIDADGMEDDDVTITDPDEIAAFLGQHKSKQQPPPDWVMNNKTHEVRDDPNVHKAGDVGSGETYIGKTGLYIDIDGIEVKLKADGSWDWAEMNDGTAAETGQTLGAAFQASIGAKGLMQFAEVGEILTGFLGGGIGGLEEAGISLANDAPEITEEISEGIYQFTAASGKTYVGQSGNISSRIAQHLASGKLLPGDLSTLEITEILGGKTFREVAEQMRINSLGGIFQNGVKVLENFRNPIGIARQYLLP